MNQQHLNSVGKKSEEGAETFKVSVLEEDQKNLKRQPASLTSEDYAPVTLKEDRIQRFCIKMCRPLPKVSSLSLYVEPFFFFFFTSEPPRRKRKTSFLTPKP